MIKKLTLKNFEVHRKSALEFVPGVNVIAGPSDHGKSSIVRALGLVLLNRPQGLSYVRNTEEDTKTKAVVGAMFDDCEISRVRSKSDNYYTLNGQQLKAMGAAVPDEIAHASRMNELNIQFQFSRKMQHYLLSLSSGEVARYLNALLELDIIDETLKKVAQGKYIILPGSEGKLLFTAQNLLGRGLYPVMDMMVNLAIAKIKFGK